MIMRCLLGLILALVIPAVGRGATTQADLWLSESAAKPGTTITAAVHLKMAPKWHTYWRNPGDSGQPTKIKWDLPKGITAGEIQWPAPEKDKFDDLYTYVYREEVALLVPLTIGADAPAGAQTIKANVTWLECEVQCIQGKQSAQAALVIAGESKTSAEAAKIDEWKAKIPQPKDDVEFSAQWDGSAKGEERKITFTVNKSSGAWDFFNDRLENADLSGSTETLPVVDGKVRFRKTVKKFEGTWPAQLTGLLLIPGDATTAREVKVAIAEGKLDAPAAAATGGKTGIAARANTSLLAVLGGAFLGGLILNIMPCVLPVIALKILGFVRQSKEDPRRIRKLGLVYGLGVVVSFLVLAGFVIGVKHSTGSATWGMQFQNPKFLIAITSLVTLIALSLFGVFEINLGGGAMNAAGTLASREGASGAFFNGALATILATPCTAPFLAPALGFAFTQSDLTVLLIFVAIAVGMAFPYVVLCWFPAWLKKMPKPGPWMERFKNAMGFPMLATAIWLFSVSLAHFGKAGALPFGLFLVTISFAAWVYGEFVQRGTRRRGVSGIFATCLLAFGIFYFLPALGAQPDAIQWKAWSPAAVETARAQKRAVLVDFTADWCLTCQVNKKTSLEISSVREKLKELNVTPMLADNTKESPEIAAELKKYERAGVPLVLVFPADPNEPVIVLPEVLTPNIVLEALNKAAAGGTKLSRK
jgi:thiol:disulfide interchange protein